MTNIDKRAMENGIWNYRRLLASSQGLYFEYSDLGKLKDQIMGFLGTEDDSVFLDEQTLRNYGEMLWETNKEHCHEKCKGHFLAYYDMPYAHYKPGRRHGDATGGKRVCLVCARPLACSGGQEHAYVTLTQQECRAKNILHFGNCYTVSECKHCGDVFSVDSSG